MERKCHKMTLRGTLPVETNKQLIDYLSKPVPEQVLLNSWGQLPTLEWPNVPLESYNIGYSWNIKFESNDSDDTGATLHNTGDTIWSRAKYLKLRQSFWKWIFRRLTSCNIMNLFRVLKSTN